MKIKIKELGYGLISLLLFQAALSIVSIKTSLNFIELKNYTDTLSLSSPQLISEIVTSSLLIISIVLFIFAKKPGSILYICTIALSLILSILFSTLTIGNLLISLIIPGATILLVYIKRDIIFNI